jgi:cell division protein FtsN
MRQGFRAVVAGGLAFAVSLIAACGSSTGLLSADTATSLTNQLQQVSSDLQQGNCAAAHDELAKLSQDIQNLPSSVSSTLRSNLNEGLTRAQELAATQCKSPTSTTPTTTTATTTTPTTTTETATQPTTTQTTPTQTTPTTTPPATTPVNPGTTSTGPGSGGVAPGTNNGNGKGNGNGNGH